MSEQINFQILFDKKYHHPEALFHLGTVCLEKGQYQLALGLFQRVLKKDPEYHMAYKPLARVYEHLQLPDLAHDCYMKLWDISPTVELALEMGYFLKSQFKSIQALYYFQQAFQQALQKPIEPLQLQPSILISTLPKSGSAYIYHALTKGILLKLNYKEIAISSRVFFPQDIIQPFNFKQFLQRPSVSNEHLPALKDNLRCLTQYPGKWMVHVRDPRQALLSWYYFLEGQEHNKMNQHYLHPGYYHDSREDKLNWQIQHQLPLFIDWLVGWMKFFQDKRQPRVLLTFYRELRNEPEGFFSKILDYFELDKESFSHPESPKNGHYHYRKGDLDEWRESFSPLQKVAINNLVSEELLTFYGWER